MQETQVWSLDWEDPLEEEMATHSSIHVWKIPWTEGPGGLQSRGSQRVGHDWVTEYTCTLSSWQSYVCVWGWGEANSPAQQSDVCCRTLRDTWEKAKPALGVENDVLLGVPFRVKNGSEGGSLGLGSRRLRNAHLAFTWMHHTHPSPGHTSLL